MVASIVGSRFVIAGVDVAGDAHDASIVASRMDMNIRK